MQNGKSKFIIFAIYTIKSDLKWLRYGKNCQETNHGISGRLIDGDQLGSIRYIEFTELIIFAMASLGD